MAEARAASHRWHYDMAFTHAELRYYLAGATGHVPIVDEGKVIHHNDGALAWRMTLSDERIGGIALIRMPRTEVTLELFGYTEDQAAAWHKRFMQHYQRGGG